MKNKIIMLFLLLGYNLMIVPRVMQTTLKSLGTPVKNDESNVKIGACYDACKHRHMPEKYNAERSKAEAILQKSFIEGYIYAATGSISAGLICALWGKGKQIPVNAWLLTLLGAGYTYDWISEVIKSGASVTLAHDVQKVPDHMLRSDICKKDGHVYIDTSKFKFSRAPFKLVTIAVACAALFDSLRQGWDRVFLIIQHPLYPYAAPRFEPYHGEGHTLGSS